MEWPKTSDDLALRFDRALPEDPQLARRKMFGYPSVFLNGNMFAGLHGDSVILRLPENQRDELLALEGARVFEPMAGRPMREYVVAPGTVVDDPKALRDWLARAFAYATTLPPKSKAKSETRSPSRGRK